MCMCRAGALCLAFSLLNDVCGRHGREKAWDTSCHSYARSPGAHRSTPTPPRGSRHTRKDELYRLKLAELQFTH